ncbi:hypothetical protein C8R48DRAFT_594433, partial [Suillus tomentosus]
GEPLNEFLRSSWQRQMDTETPNYWNPPLPLTCIKKVTSDPDVNRRYVAPS